MTEEIKAEFQKTYLTYASITPIAVKHQLMDSLKKIEAYIEAMENQKPAEQPADPLVHQDNAHV